MTNKLLPIGAGTFQSIDEISKIVIVGNTAKVTTIYDTYDVDGLSTVDKDRLRVRIVNVLEND